MLISELIVRHLGPQRVLHERGIRLNQTQVPDGVHAHRDGDDVAPVVGDLLVVAGKVGPGLREQIDTDLPVGATMLLLLEVDVAKLPVGRVLAALAFAKLQVVEAAVVTGATVETVAVVATRTDDLIVPQPYLANLLEPGDHQSPAVLRRVLGEHALGCLVQPARERALRVAIGELEASLAAERGDSAAKRRDERRDKEALVRELKTARKQLQSVRSSRSFKLARRVARAARAARMAQVAQLPRRIARRLARVRAHGLGRG